MIRTKYVFLYQSTKLFSFPLCICIHLYLIIVFVTFFVFLFGFSLLIIFLFSFPFVCFMFFVFFFLFAFCCCCYGDFFPIFIKFQLITSFNIYLSKIVSRQSDPFSCLSNSYFIFQVFFSLFFSKFLVTCFTLGAGAGFLWCSAHSMIYTQEAQNWLNKNAFFSTLK